MPEQSAGNLAQIRLIAEQIAEAVIVKYATEHPSPPPKPEIPPSLKLAGAVITAFLTAAVIGIGFWIVTTLSEMQVTVARIDERQQSSSGDTTGKFQEIDRRISNLESFHRQGAKE